MDTNGVRGTVRSIADKAEDAYGRITGEDKDRVQGAMDQVSDALQDTYSRAADTVQDSGRHLLDRMQQRPMTALLMAAGAGFVLSWLLRR